MKNAVVSMGAILCLAGAPEEQSRPVVSLAADLAVTQVAPAAIQGQHPAAQNPAAAEVIKFSVSPQAQPRPALRYQLLPDAANTVSGNAALIYLVAFETGDLTKLNDQIDRYLTMPIHELPIHEAAELVSQRQHLLQDLELAARRERCDWGVPLREEGVNALLPYLNYCRGTANLLALQARVQIAQGKFDDAIRSLQTGFAFVNHLNDHAVLVQQMAAVGISSLLMEWVVRDFEQAPGAPNLYWALANLPNPQVDLRGAIRLERSLIPVSLPTVKTGDPLEHSPRELEAIFTQIEQLEELFGIPSARSTGPIAYLGQMTRAYGRAKQWFASRGYDKERIDALPVKAALAAYFVADYRERTDDLFKWAGLPYWQAQAGIRRAEAQLAKAREDDPNPLLRMAAGLGRADLVVARSQRRLALAQCVEALRGYAAEHSGKLPATLADLTEMPAPPDPVTGQAFGYELAGATATLTAADSHDSAAPEERIEVTIRP